MISSAENHAQDHEKNTNQIMTPSTTHVYLNYVNMVKRGFYFIKRTD